MGGGRESDAMVGPGGYGNVLKKSQLGERQSIWMRRKGKTNEAGKKKKKHNPPKKKKKKGHRVETFKSVNQKKDWNGQEALGVTGAGGLVDRTNRRGIAGNYGVRRRHSRQIFQRSGWGVGESSPMKGGEKRTLENRGGDFACTEKRSRDCHGKGRKNSSENLGGGEGQKDKGDITQTQGVTKRDHFLLTNNEGGLRIVPKGLEGLTRRKESLVATRMGS